MSYDLLVRGGLIVDGTGKKGYVGDVAVQDGQIVAVGQVDRPGRRTIQAAGLVVAPGFIDAHTHYDAQLLWDPSANPSCNHGVTTIVMGNCGYTLAPVRAKDQDYVMGLFSAVEEVPKAALQARAPFAWESFRDYLAWLRRRRIGVNVASQVGHSAVRRFVMGDAALERAASEDEIVRMAAVVEAAFDAGAWGFSTSQAPHQVGEFGEHIPPYFAADEEVEALAAVVRKKGGRLLSITPRSKREGLNEQDRRLLVKLAQISGAAVFWNDFGGGSPWWQSVLDYMEGEGERGNPIYGIARCQPSESRFTLRKLSFLFATFEPWIEYSRLDHAAKMQALRDPVWRERLIQAAEHAPFMSQAGVELGATPAIQKLGRRLLTDIARERGVAPVEAMLEIALEDKLETFFAVFRRQGEDEGALERILKSPAVLVGISDGGAHLQSFASGEYTTYFLQHWVQDTGVFSLAEGVRALTSRPAHLLGLTDRGTLEPGKAGDLVIFDPETIGPLPLQTIDDIPGGGTRMVKQARGVPWVIVNGQPVTEKGTMTGAVPGHIIGFKGD